MSGAIKSIAGTASGLCVEYREIDSPNCNPRYWLGKRCQPTLIVIHTAECGEIANAAENLAQWDAGSERPKASWHFAVADADITCSVDPALSSWHSGPVNGYSIGIEHAGKAAQTAEQWGDEYSRNELELSAKLVAVLCEIYQIPVMKLEPHEIALAHHAGVQPRGICGHWDVTRALGGTHHDPGPDFPWDSYMARVREIAIGAPQE